MYVGATPANNCAESDAMFDIAASVATSCELSPNCVCKSVYPSSWYEPWFSNVFSSPPLIKSLIIPSIIKPVSLLHFASPYTKSGNLSEINLIVSSII